MLPRYSDVTCPSALNVRLFNLFVVEINWVVPVMVSFPGTPCTGVLTEQQQQEISIIGTLVKLGKVRAINYYPLRLPVGA